MDREDYVSFEVAKLLKEKGFNEQCRYTYCGESEDVYVSNNKNSCYPNNVCSMPTLYEAQKWLMKEYCIYVHPCPYLSKDLDEVSLYIIEAYKYQNRCWIQIHIDCGKFKTYEEALNTGIIEVLKII